ncbi:hypothetical protein BOX15_Mlig010873g2 [Macrostomum lignano]|uniref:EF-hand domain-containing protein n=1 Tax=Macrostomum lignano TaxID=282301 RepID=A0A267G9G7_9PLAT|nr:hypothetical protein BOX15_Mlig010873g2 [Macrostomum lignano]
MDRRDLELFKNVFVDLDPLGTGQISIQQMWPYFKRNRIPDAKINLFMNTFDHDNDGYITLDEFCRVFSVSRAEVLGQTVTYETRSRVASGLPAGVTYISGDMDIAWQIKIAQLCIETLGSTSVLKDVPRNIKTSADRMFNNLWHIVMVNGQFWCYYGHEPGYSFVFSFEKYIFVVWKTPAM